MTKAAILCVDDEPGVLESLEIELQKAFGDIYAYEFAQSADEALEIIDELVVELVDILVIVSDWLMPGIRGDEFLIIIHKKYPSITKIMLTGQADKDAIDRAINQANLHACLHKPWDTQELIKTIKSAIANL
jgi:DNA-binding NtrC family response regulator